MENNLYLLKVICESVVEGLNILWWEDTHSASAAPPPGQMTGAVQQLDDVASLEMETGAVGRTVVTQSMGHTRLLQKWLERLW